MSLQDIRSHRVFNIAIFDLVLSVVGTVIVFLFAWWKWFPKLHWWKFVIAGVLLTIPLGIFFHVIFGVNTQLNYTLGLSNKPQSS